MRIGTEPMIESFYESTHPTNTKAFEVDKADRITAEKLVELVDREFDLLSAEGKKVFVLTLGRKMGNKISDIKRQLWPESVRDSSENV